MVPSHSENLGGAVEPLLSGVPVIATKVGGLPDLVQDGVSGRLIPPRNPRAIADAMLASLQNHAETQRLAVAGNKMTRQLFDVQRTAGEVAQIYATLKPSFRSNPHDAGTKEITATRRQLVTTEGSK